MNNLIKEEINNIVMKIIDKTSVVKIILFGSYAYGTPDSDSDIDLCVISKLAKRKIEILREIRKSLRGSTVPIDILVYDETEFKDRANSTTSMEHLIEQKGIVLYG